jgi:hypothetical protein
MPAGIETMIAIEKPKAMITNNALIFLLDKFLTALVKAPISFTASKNAASDPKKRDGKQSILASFHPDGD